MAHFAASVALGDDGQGQAHQRTHVGGQSAVAARHQHHVILGAQAGHDLDHMGIARPRHAFDAFQQRDLFGSAEGRDRIDIGIQAAAVFGFDLGRDLDLAGATAGNARTACADDSSASADSESE